MYRIFAFDGVELPQYVQDNDAHNIGTGQALTSFQQISGGYFDNYGARKSPQGIRPITLSGVFHASTSSALITAVDAMRAKIGVRGKLSAYFDDGSMRWQWARLQSINTPRQAENRNWLPFDMTFITASQIWYRVIVSPSEWTVGDTTWTFGDGTAEVGESGTLETLTASGTDGLNIFTINHGGNVDATNVAISVTAGTNSITALKVANRTRRELFSIGETIATGERLTVNGGDRSVWLYGVARNIALLSNPTGVTMSITTSSNHGLTTGDDVYIAGCSISQLDGIWRDVTRLSDTQFSFPCTVPTTLSESTVAGTVQELTSRYNNFRQNASQWPVLSPGDNVFHITLTGNAAQDATIAWEFYEHYA